MNPLTQFKKTLILPILIGPALVIVAALTAVPALATPPSGVTTESLLLSDPNGLPLPGTFEEMNLFAKAGNFWRVLINTKGESDLYVVRVTFDPGGYTGWHTHPGPSLITVISGTLTVYDGDDPTCTPHVYPAGSTFIDPPDHVHFVRNETGTTAVDVAVQLVARGALRRIDVTPAPGNCPF